MYIVYVITNLLNSKVYVGLSSQSMDDRWYGHRNDARNGSRYYFHRALRKYGFESWKHDVVRTCETFEEAASAEREIIAQLEACHPRKGYNRTLGGDGCAASEATRRKISETCLGKQVSSVTRAKMSASQSALVELGLCQFQRPEVQAQARAARVGIPHSEATRRKMSAAHTGKKMSEAARKKMSQAHEGVPLSDEHRRAMSEAQLGHTVSEDTKQKIRAKRLGTRMSDEARLKMSIKAKERHARNCEVERDVS